MRAKKRAKGESYLHIGDPLRAELLEGITAADADAEHVERVKNALRLAAPHSGGYLLDMHGWTRGDKKFLKTILDTISWRYFLSHGFSGSKTPFGQQLRALQEAAVLSPRHA